MPRQRIEIPEGKRFGRLVVQGEGEPVQYGKDSRPNRTLNCQCDCGNVTDVPIRKLLYGGQVCCSRSCALGPHIKHGMATRANRDPIYNCWQGIIARCEHPKATGYKYWGGRGITVYGPWHDPAVFKADVEREIGPRPGQDWTIDRKDVDGNYEPGNIAWLTKARQPLNRRPLFNSTVVAVMFAEMMAQHHCPGCQCS